MDTTRLEIPKVKQIPKELEPLAQEARKYKSAEEFATKTWGTPTRPIKTMEDLELIAQERQDALRRARVPGKVYELEDLQRLKGARFSSLTDFYNQSTKGIKEVKPDLQRKDYWTMT
jgi:hypothetical protein